MLPPPSQLLQLPQGDLDLSPPPHHNLLPVPHHHPHHSSSPHFPKSKENSTSSSPSLNLSLTPRSGFPDLRPASYDLYLDSHPHHHYSHHGHQTFRKSLPTLANTSDHHSLSRLGGDTNSPSETRRGVVDKEDLGYYPTPQAWMTQETYSAPATQSHFTTTSVGTHGQSGQSGQIPPPSGISIPSRPSMVGHGGGSSTLVGSAPSTFHYGIPNTASTSTNLNVTGSTSSSSSSLAPFLERRLSVPGTTPIGLSGSGGGLEDYLHGQHTLLQRALYPSGGVGGGEQSQSLHEIPTSPSRALGCFSSHSAQSTTSVSSTHSLQPLTPSVSPKWGRAHGHSLGLGLGLGSVEDVSSSSTQGLARSGSGIGGSEGGGGPASHPGVAGDGKHHHHHHHPPEKQYSFIALPGSHVRKRPRRRYDEIERLYECNWPGCTKAYGTLNHLNAHVHMQKHGPKRTPQEFKEMRKRWRAGQKLQKEAQAAMAQVQAHVQAGLPPETALYGSHLHLASGSSSLAGVAGTGGDHHSLAHIHGGYNVHPHLPDPASRNPHSTRAGLSVSIPGGGHSQAFVHHSEHPHHPHQHQHQQYAPPYASGGQSELSSSAYHSTPHVSHSHSTGWMGDYGHGHSAHHPGSSAFSLSHPHPHRSLSLRLPQDDELDLDYPPPTSATSELISPGGAWSHPAPAPSSFPPMNYSVPRRSSASQSPVDDRSGGAPFFPTTSQGEWGITLPLTTPTGAAAAAAESNPASGNRSASGSGSGTVGPASPPTGGERSTSSNPPETGTASGRLPPDSTLLTALQTSRETPSGRSR